MDSSYHKRYEAYPSDHKRFGLTQEIQQTPHLYLSYLHQTQGKAVQIEIAGFQCPQKEEYIWCDK